jgi:hypothetical protein
VILAKSWAVIHWLGENMEDRFGWDANYVVDIARQ